MSVFRCARYVCAGVSFASAVAASDLSSHSGPVQVTSVEVSGARSGPPEGTATADIVVGDTDARGPRLNPCLSERVTARLEDAIPIAKDHIQENSSCQRLFAQLGSDGVFEIDTTAYYAASRKQERKYCRRGVAAITTLGGSDVVICRSFVRLSGDEAAIILIHEALHSAGQLEYPGDADSPDTFGITRMVMRSCGFFEP